MPRDGRKHAPKTVAASKPQKHGKCIPLGKCSVKISQNKNMSHGNRTLFMLNIYRYQLIRQCSGA